MEIIKKFKSYIRPKENKSTNNNINDFKDFHEFESILKPYFMDIKDAGFQVHFVDGPIYTNRQEVKDIIGRGSLDMSPRFEIPPSIDKYVIIEPNTTLHHSGMFGHRYFIEGTPDLEILEMELKNCISHVRGDFNIDKIYYHYMIDQGTGKKKLEGREDITNDITFKKIKGKIPPFKSPFITFFVKIIFK